MDTGTAQSPNFLELLDALVRRDGATSGLSGEVCVGLREDGAFQWWSAAFTPSFRVQFEETRSNSAHATLFIDSADAAELLRTGTVDAPRLLTIDGDRDLLIRFIRRYTSRTDWLGIRLAGTR